MPEIKLGTWSLKPLAKYQIKARVLSKAAYSGDPMGEIAPYDLAVAWGRMSDTAIIDQFDFRQSYRYFYWNYYGSPPPLPVPEIKSHAVNMHLIPSSDSVLSAIRGLRKGSLVEMTGYLVEATSSNDPQHPIKSSLTRADSGPGACEVMWVQKLVELD